MTLGLSTQSIQSLLSKKDWVDIYLDEFKKRYTKLIKSSFTEEYFNKYIKAHLGDYYTNDQIRNSIQKWMLIANHKAQALIMILRLIPHQYSSFEKINKKYKKIPLGPQEESIIKKMTKREIKRWHDGNIAISFAGTSNINLYSLFVSELFFSAEAYCRTICIGSCLEFALKALSSSVTIQHDEIYRTLKRLGNIKEEKIVCKICLLKNTCNINSSYQSLADTYELLYHLRTIKDYKLEFYFNKEFLKFLIQEIIPHGINILTIFDESKRKLFLGYLNSPFSLSELQVKVNKILN